MPRSASACMSSWKKSSTISVATFLSREGKPPKMSAPTTAPTKALTGQGWSVVNDHIIHRALINAPVNMIRILAALNSRCANGKNISHAGTLSSPASPRPLGKYCLPDRLWRLRHNTAQIRPHLILRCANVRATSGKPGANRFARHQSLPGANRRRRLRRFRMVPVVAGEDRLKRLPGPKFRSANFFQAGRVPI